MEKQTEQKREFTQEKAKNESGTQLGANVTNVRQSGVGLMLSPQDAAEYRAYKRQRKLSEISSAISRSSAIITGKEDVASVCERALRLRQNSIKLRPSRLLQTAGCLSPLVKIDCIVGGDGETLTKVKAYEAKQAAKRFAKEITLIITPSWVADCRYSEIKREIKKMRRVTKKLCLKVFIDENTSPTTRSRLARICSEAEVDYVSVPYFLGCERLRFDLSGKCRLEVVGVETLADYKKMVGAGVQRIVSSHIWEIYMEWLKEAEKQAMSLGTELPAIVVAQNAETTVKKPASAVTTALVAVEKAKSQVENKTAEEQRKTDTTEKKAGSLPNSSIGVPCKENADGKELKFL